MMVNDLLPECHSYYHFGGTPITLPCNECVSWLLMKSPIPYPKNRFKRLNIPITITTTALRNR
ncbi:MAG: hypothetical protein HOP04_11585 [Methylophilaceae bacterium]|nr:hypothetical protein [Methylophilaceae bacterium]